MGRSADDVELAWALAAVARPRLSATQRIDVYVLLGGGEMFSAISTLIIHIANHVLPLESEIHQQCMRWLDGYAYHGDWANLRARLDEIPSQHKTSAEITPSRLTIVRHFKRRG